MEAAAARLARAGISAAEARLDAALLARTVLAWDRAAFVAHRREAVPEGFVAGFEAVVARRARREPIAYILGRREFWGLDLEVTPATLIPRPETELVVETVALEHGRRAPGTIVDVGTGCGCLAIALARLFPEARLVATDVSADALAVARRNAERHGVIDRIELEVADLLGDRPRASAVDLIVANPPYVPTGARARLAPEVARFEPPAALFAGADGLDVIRRLLAAAPAALTDGGLLVIELGAGQANAVARLVHRTPGLFLRGVRDDLQGIPRVAIARRETSSDRDSIDGIGTTNSGSIHDRRTEGRRRPGTRR